MSAGTVALILLGLVLFDERIRLAISRTFAGRPVSELETTGQHVQSFAALVFAVVREQSSSHTPLVVFTLAGAVLVVFMLRT